MELRYPFVIYIGAGVIAILIALLFINIKPKKGYKGGKKVVNTLIEDEPYYKKKIIQYKIFSIVIAVACLIAIAGSFLMLARPYKTKIVNKEQYNRDIMLCIDVSTSVDYLNMKLIDELVDTVNNLKGERFGIVIFNTSSVLLAPLTDDYEYIIEQLEEIKRCLKMRIDYEATGYLPNDWMAMNQFISSGTLVGNAERGSSIIGDGLATAVYDFTNLDTERPRIIIFCTDNDIQGTPIVTVPEAADIAIKKKVTVYGVGTKEMTDANLFEMKSAVEKTGGKFYLEEESGSFKDIVESINKESKAKLKVETEMKKVERAKPALIIMLLSIAVMMIFTRVTRR